MRRLVSQVSSSVPLPHAKASSQALPLPRLKLLLSLFSSARVRDTASGMRVLRRSSLRKLLPLPDGLHFTPAMSARGLMSRDLKIAEIDMPYHEREGKSKLRMMKDGTRFLKAIMD